MRFFDWNVSLTTSHLLQYTVSILIQANMTIDKLDALNDPYGQIQRNLNG